MKFPLYAVVTKRFECGHDYISYKSFVINITNEPDIYHMLISGTKVENYQY